MPMATIAVSPDDLDTIQAHLKTALDVLSHVTAFATVAPPLTPVEQLQADLERFLTALQACSPDGFTRQEVWSATKAVIDEFDLDPASLASLLKATSP